MYIQKYIENLIFVLRILENIYSKMYIQKYIESLIFVVRTSQNVYSKIC